MFIDTGLECDWTWPLATLCRDGCGAAMQCAVITYSWGAGTLGVIVTVTRPQTTLTLTLTCKYTAAAAAATKSIKT